MKHPWFKTFIAGAGFMSDSYDLFVIDTVNNMLKDHYGQTADQKAAVSNSALIGSVLGQVFFGFAGEGDVAVFRDSGGGATSAGTDTGVSVPIPLPLAGEDR